MNPRKSFCREGCPQLRVREAGEQETHIDLGLAASREPKAAFLLENGYRDPVHEKKFGIR